MTQNKKKGIAKKALSISLVAAMLATSNVPAWASGFEAVDEPTVQGFSVEDVGETNDMLGDAAISDILIDSSSNDTYDLADAGGNVVFTATVSGATDQNYYAIVATGSSVSGAKVISSQASGDSVDLSLAVAKSDLKAGTLTVQAYESAAEITADNYSSATAVGNVKSFTLTDTTPTAPVTVAEVYTNTSSVTNKLASNIAWIDTKSMNAVLTAADGLTTAAGYDKVGTPSIVFVNGSVNPDGTLPAGSVEAGMYQKDTAFQEYYGKTIAVKVQAQKSGDVVKTFYLAGAAIVDEVDIAVSDQVSGWEVTVNGKTFTDADKDPKIEKADAYKITNAKLYLTKDKKTAVSLKDTDDGISMSVTNPNVAVDQKLNVEISATTQKNTSRIKGVFTTDVATVSGKDLSTYVTFGSGNYTYNPSQKADTDFIKKLVDDEVVKVDAKLDASNYEVKVYKNNSGVPYSNTEVIAAGNLYVGVEGKANTSYAGQKVIIPTPLQVAKKDLSTLVEVQDIIDAIEWGGSAAIAEANIDSKLDEIVTYDGKAEFKLKTNASREKLSLEISYPKKAGEKATIVVTPAKDNTNYTGTKTITFTPKVKELPLGVKTEFTRALKEAAFDYDAKAHVVQNLIGTKDLDVVSGGQYTLSVKEKPVTEIKDADTYTIVLTVTDGAYKGLKAEAPFTIGKRDVTNLFTNGVGVSANTLVYNPDGYGTAEEKMAAVKPVFTYNGEVLDANDMTADPTITIGGSGDAGDTITVSFTGEGNYRNSASVKIGTIQKKDIGTLELPEIPTQPYDSTIKYTSLSKIKIEDVTGSKKGYDKFVVDGKQKEALTENTDYICDIDVPSNGIGTVTVTLRGKGNYTGSAVKKFEVTKNAITADIGTLTSGTFKNVIEDVPYSYTAANSKNGITLDFKTATNVGGTIIVRDRETGNNVTENCNITYKENRAAGTATVEANGKDGYDIYASATFKILPKVFTTSTVTLKQDNATAEDTWTYTEATIEPKLKEGNFTDGEYTLKEGIDFEISYSNNVKAANANDTDAPTILIKGKGNYVFANKNNTGVKKTFNIAKVNLAAANVVVKDVEYAGGLQVTPDIKVYNPNTQKEVDKAFYTFKFTDGTGTNAGPAKATLELTDKGKEGYTTTPTLNISFMITKKSLSSCTASLVNGKVVIKNGEITVPETEYTATKNEDGSYTVKAAEKNYTGTITVKETAPEATTLKVTNRTTSSVSLAWDKVEGAQGYTIWFRSEYDSSVSRKVINGGDVTKWTQTGLQAGTKYFYTVKAWVKDAEGKYVFSEQSKTQRGTTKPMAAKITAASAANGKIKVTLAGKAAGAEMYSMCYADSRSAFAANDFKVGIRTSYTTRTLSKTFSKGTYYVCVKSYRDLGNGAKVYGAWSNTFKVVVK